MPHPVPSLWAATAVPAPETPPLRGANRADVAIIGAGFTGLSAALKLAEGGAEVTVVDSHAPGFGASGRNGGQVIPGLKYDPDTLDRLYGEATTDFAGRTAETTFGLIEKHAIACEPMRKGWIQASLKTSHLPTLEGRMRQWQARGAPVEMLDAAQMAARTGSQSFAGGWLDGRAGSLHPLSYARGLAQAAIAAGAKIYGDSEASALKRSPEGWTISLASGASLEAREAIVATNGYTGPLWPKLKATVIPANSIQVATVPLPEALLAEILPERMVVSDSRRITNYFRIGPGGRLMMGGRGSFSEPEAPADYRRIIAAMHRFFPQTRELALDYFWAGRVAMTRDHLPHIHQPFENLTMALGYNGRGVALASALGQAIGAHLLDRTSPLPLKLTEIDPMPVHGLHPIYASAMISYYRLRDALES
ncbi:FAD-binding oxidoreductase [Afifella sp. IM 167]|uniref:NAD(P)/FAD-dependent oxidoreductase n=1 Tax=Afifella sp. IM 167 TaxID=2033586 RepID=UPI001CCCDF56|nr:FAD-binding oxidoreductase [Afifella sp. IM 167]MBZ8133748.1 FAD-dependent oxidoreductase [Afifella sp. IM 167]